MVKRQSTPPSHRLPALSPEGAGVMNVLVASDDSAFRRVTAFLLSRRGFVTTELRRACLAKMIGEPLALGAEALVIDVDGDFDQADVTVSLLEESNPGLAVMLVTRDRDAALWGEDHGLRLFSKWDAFDDLVLELDGLRLATRRAGLP